jgi:hypothetical protein
MNLQSCPAGQQSTAIADDSIWRHFVDVGQQKSDGNDAPHCDNEVSSPQTELSSVSRRRSLDAGAIWLRVLVRLDERSSSSVALIGNVGVRIAAADRLITEQ